MKTEEKLASNLKDAIRDVLSTICRKDENGLFYEEIYANY